MTVLVTGGAGYIGSHMVHALVDAGESVVVIDNLSTGFAAFLPEGVPLFIGDAGDENLVGGVIAQHGIESIIHFAGSIVVPDSVRDPLGYYRNNTMTTRSLLNAAVKSGVKRFIFSSTAAVYGNPEQVPGLECGCRGWCFCARRHASPSMSTSSVPSISWRRTWTLCFSDVGRFLPT